MARETKAEMQARLEQEVSKLKKQLQESWDREQQLIHENISLKDNIEDQFKQTGLFVQMQRELSTLKAENALNKGHIKAMEELRGKQATRILELEESIKFKNNTNININFETQDSILLPIENPETEEVKKIEIFNNLFNNQGVHLEILNLKNTYLKINYDTRKNKRNAGRKKKFVQGTYTLSDVEEMLKKSGSEAVANELGISRATFFRKLKKSREWGDPSERFI